MWATGIPKYYGMIHVGWWSGSTDIAVSAILKCTVEWYSCVYIFQLKLRQGIWYDHDDMGVIQYSTTQIKMGKLALVRGCPTHQGYGGEAYIQHRSPKLKF